MRHPHLGLQAAQLARRVLVFHRGAGVAQMTSYFLEEKFDIRIEAHETGVEHMDTVNDLVTLVESKRNPA